MKRIEALRALIDKDASRLQIGVSILTSKEMADSIRELSFKVKSAGAHWIYFHPLCSKWKIGSPVQEDQGEVLAGIEECRSGLDDGFRVFVLEDRYANTELHFDGYHAAHFLLAIGADGMNYLGAESRDNNDLKALPLIRQYVQHYTVDHIQPPKSPFNKGDFIFLPYQGEMQEGCPLNSHKHHRNTTVLQ